MPQTVSMDHVFNGSGDVDVRDALGRAVAMGIVRVASGLPLEDSPAALRVQAYLIDNTVHSRTWAVVNRVLPADAIADT